MESSGATRRIADFIVGRLTEPLSVEAVERAKDCVLDYVAVLLAGVDDPAATLVRRTIESMGGAAQASVWGTATRTSAPFAALANGTTAHALDFDDTSAVMIAHPSVQLLPALFALAEHEQRGALDLLTSYVVGFEVGAALGQATSAAQVARGWYPAGTIGVVMATAACAHFLKLDAGRTCAALGLATNAAGGLRCHSGSMAKPVIVGRVALNGVLAAYMAREGVTADLRAIEADGGFFDNFCGGSRERLDEAVAALGRCSHLMDSGVAFKLYPCCAATHVAVDCALEIAHRCRPTAETIASIEVTIHEAVRKVLVHRIPESSAQAKFSLEYCIARALIDGCLGLEQFEPSKLDDPRLRRIVHLVQPTYVGFAVSRRDIVEFRFPVELRVRLRDQTLLSARAECPRGSPGRPLSRDDLEEKFRRCVSRKLSPDRSARVLEVLRSLETLARVGDLAALVC